MFRANAPKGVVAIAVVLFILAAIVIVGYVSDLLRSEKLTTDVVVGGSLLALVEIALFGSTAYGLLKRKKWARWVMVAISALGSLAAFGLLLSGLASPAEKGSAYMRGQVAGTVFLVAAFAAPCLYLWRSSSARQFFSDEKTPNQPPEPTSGLAPGRGSP